MSAAEITPTNVAETLAGIRQRVAARLARTVPEIPELAVPPLEPLRQARAVAEGWSGGLGVVNPRPPGLHHRLVQGLKKLMARSLRWFAFPQVQFNSGLVAALIRIEELFADTNRNLVVLGQNIADRERKETEMAGRLSEAAARLEGASMVLNAMRNELDSHEQRLTQFFKAAEEDRRLLEHLSVSLARKGEELHGDINRVQQQFWGDFARYREEHELLHAELQSLLESELRLVRQRLRTLTEAPEPAGAGPHARPAVPVATDRPTFDYPHFEERFRGREEDIRRRQQFYLPILKGHEPVLDLACGRGEMLELLRAQGIAAHGVDLDGDMVERCRDKDLAVEHTDALAYLEAQADGSLGAVFSAQFVEHLPCPAYARLIELAYAKLRSGGLLVLETQNPECLAIYSQTFFLDPTHVKPVPAAQLQFLLTEAGFGNVEVHYLSPVGDWLPQLPLWPENGAAERWNRAAERFNRTYFGHMDYAIVGRKR